MKLKLQEAILINKSTKYPEKMIELIGRISHKSENKITNDSANRFIKMLSTLNHTSVFEHISYTFKIITDRGVSHELVRHRIASFTQESTRYVNYQKRGLIFILPVWGYYYLKKYVIIDNKKYFFKDVIEKNIDITFNFKSKSKKLNYFIFSLLNIEKMYKYFLDWKPEDSRFILPNALKTELYMTINLRSLLNFYKLRLDKSAHPQIKELAQQMLKQTPIIDLL
jgi:thymidylate synthase (FAD)